MSMIQTDIDKTFFWLFDRFGSLRCIEAAVVGPSRILSFLQEISYSFIELQNFNLTKKYFSILLPKSNAVLVLHLFLAAIVIHLGLLTRGLDEPEKRTFFIYSKQFFDPPGRPTDMACSDHYFYT